MRIEQKMPAKKALRLGWTLRPFGSLRAQDLATERALQQMTAPKRTVRLDQMKPILRPFESLRAQDEVNDGRA